MTYAYVTTEDAVRWARQRLDRALEAWHRSAVPSRQLFKDVAFAQTALKQALALHHHHQPKEKKCTH